MSHFPRTLSDCGSHGVGGYLTPYSKADKWIHSLLDDSRIQQLWDNLPSGILVRRLDPLARVDLD